MSGMLGVLHEPETKILRRMNPGTDKEKIPRETLRDFYYEREKNFSHCTTPRSPSPFPFSISRKNTLQQQT